MDRLTFASFTVGCLAALCGVVWLSGTPSPAHAAMPQRPGAAGLVCCGGPGIGDAVMLKHTMTLEGANRILAAAIAEARVRNAGGAIAVVDDGGNLVALQRLDGTFAAGAEVSIGKARTAARFKKPTAAFEQAINDGRLALTAVREMTPLQGGVPIMHDGQVVGAIGVSGAHSQVEDEQIAQAGAAAITMDASVSGH